MNKLQLPDMTSVYLIHNTLHHRCHRFWHDQHRDNDGKCVINMNHNNIKVLLLYSKARTQIAATSLILHMIMSEHLLQLCHAMACFEWNLRNQIPSHGTKK